MTTTLAQRVREYRYAKGWGPDELASRAEISRTALYQIESGKTESPRASTIRRIAIALDVDIDVLLKREERFAGKPILATTPRSSGSDFASRPIQVPANPKPPVVHGGYSSPYPSPSYTTQVGIRGTKPLPGGRHQELKGKFQEILESRLGESLARIVEETHRLLRDSGEID